MKSQFEEVLYNLNHPLPRPVSDAVPNDHKCFIRSPIDGEIIGQVTHTMYEDTIPGIVNRSSIAFDKWKQLPAPIRGDILRQFGVKVRDNKEDLAKLVQLETGKILSEALGEIQEVIDMVDYSVGLSRQLYGSVISSERPNHRLLEVWHPLGPVLVISAFNFPAAVWAWNMCLALICGNSVVWKPSEHTCMISCVMNRMLRDALLDYNKDLVDVSQVVYGDHVTGKLLLSNKKIKLVSATGSTKMGLDIASRVTDFKKTLFELGGNNAGIVMPSCNWEQAQRAIFFSAIGTAGQRCTTMRRLFVHADIYDTFVEQLKHKFLFTRVSSPLNESCQMGPLFNRSAYENFNKVIEAAKELNLNVIGGERIQIVNSAEITYDNGYYVTPALIETHAQVYLMKEETFGPLLWVMKINSLEEAIKLNNDVEYGLSSSIFTNDGREAAKFLSACGSDCGIANVNIGTSGAEIGGAFGGEKMTGGGREAGSDSWKQYMRRQTQTINDGDDVPLAQGIQFD